MFFSLNSIKKPRKQFNLLHLETSEQYFLSLKVSLHVSQKYDEIRGKLHLCSRSLVFEPKQLKLPLIKMKYSNNLLMKILKNFDQKSLHQLVSIKWDCQLLQEDIETLDLNQIIQYQKNEKDKPKNNELLEKLYIINKTQKKSITIANVLPTNAFFLKMDKLFIVNRSPISPYITETCDDNIVFSISKSNSKQNLIRFLKLYQGLTTCEDEQNYLNIVIHTTLNEGINEHKLASAQQGNKIEMLFKAKQIRPEGIVYGLFSIQRDEIVQFIPLVNSPKGKILQFNLSDTKYYIKYRHMFKQNGIEIWLHNKQKSMLFVFDDQNVQEAVFRYFYKKAQKNCLSSINREKATEQWINGIISNYDYLILLNTFANRSFNDLSAYPIFPWIIGEYNEKEFAINQNSFFRDLSKPVGALNKHRLQKYKAFLADQLKDKHQEIPPYLYPTHYSTPGTVVYYLIRKIPEFVIKLQNGVFGPTDRIFRGIDSTWYTTLNLHADSKELIPEFYSMDSDFLVNCDKLELGVTQDGEIIDDAVIPKWADSITDFVIKMRVALESEYVSANIQKWIDLIFGNKSRGEEALACDNLFYPYTYAENANWEKCRTPIERQALEVQVSEFGQVPVQLFHIPHPTRKLKIMGSIKQLEDDKKELKQQNQILMSKNQKLIQQVEQTIDNQSKDQQLVLQNQISSLQWENEKLKFNLETIRQEIQCNDGLKEKIETLHFDQEEFDNKTGFDFLNDDSLMEDHKGIRSVQNKISKFNQ